MMRLAGTMVIIVSGMLIGAYGWQSHLQGQPVLPQSSPRDLTSYRDIVKKVLPAVVSIETKVKTKTVSKGPKDRFTPRLPENLPEEFRRFFEEFEQMPEFGQIPRQGFGSGFFIEPTGVVLTNYHVVEGAEQAVVTTMDGKKYTSKDIRGDRRTDLAILVLNLKNMPYLELGNSDEMEIGDRVLAFGAPFGLTGSVTSGIVSGKGRSGLNMNMYEDFLQTDAAINPGNSGGPLINLDGKVIGINAAIKSRNGGFQGVGLAVASNLAKNVTRSLLTDGVVKRGYLGVQIRDLDPEIADRLGLAKDSGVMIAEVFDNAPAAKAGIQPGDIVTRIDNKPIKDGKILQNTVASLPLKQPVGIELLREGKTVKVQAVIEEQPPEFGTARLTPSRNPAAPRDSVALNKLGLEVADLTDSLAEELGYRKGSQGVVITKVSPGSLAADVGLKRGMLISKVDSQRVANASSAREILEKASLSRGILLQVHTPSGGTNFVLLREE